MSRNLKSTRVLLNLIFFKTHFAHVLSREKNFFLAKTSLGISWGPPLEKNYLKPGKTLCKSVN